MEKAQLVDPNEVDLESYYSALLETQNPLQANLLLAMVLPNVSMVGQPQDALRRLEILADNMSSPYGQMVGMSRA